MGNDPDLIEAMRQVIDPMAVMQRVTDRTLELISNATGVMVGLADTGGITYVCGAGRGTSHIGKRVGLSSSLSGLATRTGRTLRSDDTEADPRVDTEACRELSVASLVCVPLERDLETIGVLAVNASQPHAFSDSDVQILTRLADFLSVAIGSSRELQRVSGQLLDIDTLRADTGEPVTTSEASASASAGRYMVGILDPTAMTRVDRRHRIRAVLGAPEALSMAFQPIIDLATDRVVAIEALARFAPQPDRAPDLWFAEAHECGLGVELELLAIRRALAYLDRLPGSVALSVNIGPVAARSPGFAELMATAPVERVIVELTEHALVEDYDALTEALRGLRRQGLQIAIDDTGTGYSSLAHILKVAPEYIKLDRELTTGIDLDPVRRALAASLITFAAETGARIIAEGIEGAGELEVLQRLGVHYGQGHHLGHPVALEPKQNELAPARA